MSALKLTREKRQGIMILRLEARALGTSPGQGELIERATDEILAGGHRNMLVDVSRVAVINSTGLGFLLNLLNRVQAAEGTGRFLVGDNRRVRDLFTIVQLPRIAAWFEDEDEALASFEAGAS